MTCTRPEVDPWNLRVSVRQTSVLPAASFGFHLAADTLTIRLLHTCRPDLVGFVNGLPLVVIELKKPGVPARAAFDENLTHYRAEIPQLFWFNAPWESRMTNFDWRTLQIPNGEF